MKLRGQRHRSTEPAHQGTNVGKTDALSRPVLGSSAAEEIKDALMVPGIDAPAVVGDFENRKTELGPAPYRDVAGNSGLEIFQRVVDQVGKYLLQRQMIAGKIRQRLDANLRFGFSRLMRDGSDDTLDQFPGVDQFRLEEMARIQSPGEELRS